MKSFIKRAGALMAAATLVVASGLFSMQVKAAGTRPEVESVVVSSDSVSVGETINVSVTYTSDSAVTIQLDFYNPYAVYDYNLYSYGYSGPLGPQYYSGIGSFSASGAGVLGNSVTVSIPVTIPTSSYGNYTVTAKVTNSTGYDTGSDSLFVSNTSLDTVKPTVLSASVGTRNDGNKKYIEVVATATDDYSRTGQTSSEVAAISVAFENTDKPGTWTKTISLIQYNDIYVGKLDISTIETPGTYVLNYIQIADTAGNIATYKKSGSTLKSSSYDERYFPRNLNKVTFSVGETAGEPVTTKENTTTQSVTNASASDTNVSPKTSQTGTVAPVLAALAVVILTGAVAVMAKCTK